MDDIYKPRSTSTLVIPLARRFSFKRITCFARMNMSVQRCMCMLGLWVLCLILLHHEAQGFEYNGYCQKMCMWGRGGNLCKCNAVHFAGKRTRYPSAEVRDVSNSSPLSEEERTILQHLAEDDLNFLPPYDGEPLSSAVDSAKRSTQELLSNLKRRLSSYGSKRDQDMGRHNSWGSIEDDEPIY